MIRPADIADPRLTPARPGLADQVLEGLLRAPAYAISRPMRAAAPVADLIDDHDAVVSQLLWGEAFEVLEIRDGLAFGRATRDGRVGRVGVDTLTDPGPAPTHRIARQGVSLPLNSLVTIEQTANGQARIAGFGWVPLDSLADFHAFHLDPAVAAESFLGAPWRAGGRTLDGVDAPGLVQQALFACGQACPRDVDQQGREIGATVRNGPRRGDLALWRDHVAVLLDTERVVHACSDAGAVVIDPLAMIEARLGPAALRRLDFSH